ncbi:MAG: zinc ABC transporter substrate-binding protein [Candidatus Hydrogenedentes bacterium]|nr:zinc ABC transporter substrate-binding protein [Candidatus Hydrogenedentota bacterium]
MRFLPILAALAIAAGCAQSPDAQTAAEKGQIRITCTTGMIADAARAVAGEHADVAALMGPGVDPHLYKATQGDLEKLSAADIIFYNGLHLEGRMVEVLEKMADRKPTVAVSEDMPEDRLRTPPEFAGQHDPHVWFDVDLWKSAVDRIARALGDADPDHAQAYRSNAAAYKTELDALHAWVHDQIGSIPPDARVLITAHDAFGYFGHAYDIEVLALQGISTAAEFGLQDVDQLVDTIVSRRIKAVFIESSISPRSIETLIAGAKAKGHEVKLGGELFSDAMGAAGTPEGTYIGMVKHNVNTIVEALK